MRRLLVAAALVAVLLMGVGPALATRPVPGLPDGWSLDNGHLSWHADTPIPVGDAAIEFWAGDRLLGRPRFEPGRQTLTLDVAGADLTDLQVLAAGRRLDEGPHDLRDAAPLELPPLESANPVDPGIPGPFSTITGEYKLDDVKLPGLATPVEMQAVVVAPLQAPGRRPVVLFLHGQHEICDPDSELEWPCPHGTRPVPSYRGYLRMQRLLASQGYLTVSISANGVGAQAYYDEDGGADARAALIRAHLTRWATWTAPDRPAIMRRAPLPDLSNVLLVGHSRGGEGVSRAAMDTLANGRSPWTIRGLVLIAPTAVGQNPVPDVPSVTVLPGCDGDLFNHQGEMYLDATRGVSRGTALHGALFVIGANHNYFNTVWSSDDWSYTRDPVCGARSKIRLGADQQQAVGATAVAAAARLFIRGDDRVRPLLDGSGVRAASYGNVRVLSHAVGGGRTPVLLPDPSVKVDGPGRICDGATRDLKRACITDGRTSVMLTHFTQFRLVAPEAGRYGAELAWSSAGQTVRFTPASPVSVDGAQALALRVIVPRNAAAVRFRVAAHTTDGVRRDLGEVRLDGLPGTPYTNGWWGQEIRVRLSGVREKLVSLDLTPQSRAGRAWLVDAWAWHPGTPDPQETALPRVDLGEQTVTASTSPTATIPVTVTGTGDGQVRLFLVDHHHANQPKSWIATLRPADRTIPLRISPTAPTSYDLYAKAVRGVTVGDFEGGLTVKRTR